jgi:hypothetical protein
MCSVIGIIIQKPCFVSSCSDLRFGAENSPKRSETDVVPVNTVYCCISVKVI